MTPTKDRQRAAARARLEREMAERAAQAQQRRKRNTTIAAAVGGVVAVAIIVVLIVTLATGGDKKPTAAGSPSATASATGTASCTWLPNPDPSASPAPSANPNLQNVGTPPTTVPGTGDSTMTITTSQGTITAKLDLAHAPCAAASLAYLSSKGFYNNTHCHRLTTTGFYVLQCGDPSGTGQGGPTYTYNEENLPTGNRPTYLEGDIAIANTGSDGTNGSQFFIVYRDTPDATDDGSGTSALDAQYTLVGHVTTGIDVVQKVADGGVVGDTGDGEPKTRVDISSLTVAAPPWPSPSASAPATPAPTPSS